MDSRQPGQGRVPLVSEALHFCRVCGWRHERPPWGLDGKTPFFTHCDCCGNEVGWQDRTPDLARKTRAQWIARGTPWFSRALMPADWNLERQLANIPQDYR